MFFPFLLCFFSPFFLLLIFFSLSLCSQVQGEGGDNKGKEECGGRRAREKRSKGEHSYGGNAKPTFGTLSMDPGRDLFSS
jgi:hypothetical protein